MNHLSSEAKERVVQTALNRGVQPLEDVAKQHGIGLSTLQRWLKRHRDGHGTSARANSRALSRAEKFEHILASNGLDDVSLGKYCRQQGIYSHQLNTWRTEIMSNNQQDKTKTTAAFKALKAENKRLQQELRRKDKALAEVSALLILKKKADLIWGENEDD